MHRFIWFCSNYSKAYSGYGIIV